MQARSIIVGTAGHIDHGKTALIRALTGIDTDRLKEEKRRGITIELGFAHHRVDDLVFGIVDVPGHERFIKSMVAGAGGIDLVVLVIAADEGVMPQTREHLDICQLLGVRRGLVALTKVDLVDEDWLALVRDDVRQTLRHSFLAQAPIVACSATTDLGIDRLSEALIQAAAQLPPRDPSGLLRMPLDRVFTIKGFGTVVTGSLLSGAVAPGDEVAILPRDVRAAVRRVQVHGAAVERAVAGQRTAINLAVDRQEVARGEVLAVPGTLAPSPILDAELELLPGVRQALKARTKVLFHLGTRQQEASCVLLTARELGAGQRALAQLRFDEGVVALPEDRFILRGFVKQHNHGTTIGGGTVVRVLCPKLRPRDQEAIALLQRMARATGVERVELEVLAAGRQGIGRSALQQRLPLPPRALARQLDELLSQRRIVRFDRESGAVVHGEHARALRTQLLAVVDDFHRQQPLRIGISRAELRSRLGIDQRLFHALLQPALQEGLLAIDQDLCRRSEHRARMEASVGPLAQRILATYREAGLGPPWEADLPAQLDEDSAPVAAALRLLVEQGRLTRVGSLVFLSDHLADLERRLRALLADAGEITPTQFKALVGQSRKFTIPLAEYFDAQGVTTRVGDVRRPGTV